MAVVAAVLAVLVVVIGMISMLLVGTHKRVEFLLREWPAAAEALGTTLLQLLDDVDEAVQTAAAEALGEVGSVAAVEPLLLLSKGLGRARLRQAARGAIARIQSRLADVEAGRLSLATDDGLAGAVALADTELAVGGEVTLAAETEAPPLSQRS